MNEDPTKDLPDGEEKTPTTRVMLETILAKMNDLSAKFDGLNARVDALSERVDALSERVDTLSLKMEEGFRNVNRRIDILSIDINNLRADVAGHAHRIEQLEKAS